MRNDVESLITTILRNDEEQYVTDDYTDTLERAFLSLESKYRDVNQQAQIIASNFVSGVNSANRERFYKSMNQAVGVDLASVIQNEGIGPTLKATTRQNVALIRTIPEEYFKKIETMVYTETTQGSSSRSIIKQIRDIGFSTEKRARLIARDQTSKLNSALNQKRQENLGVEEYVWRTVGDERVRDSHRAKNGKTFRWDNPPKDTGHPGADIQCRCVAQPILNL